MQTCPQARCGDGNPFALPRFLGHQALYCLNSGLQRLTRGLRIFAFIKALAPFESIDVFTVVENSGRLQSQEISLHSAKQAWQILFLPNAGFVSKGWASRASISLLAPARLGNALIMQGISQFDVLPPPSRSRGPFPDRTRDTMSAKAPKPYPLCPRFLLVLPRQS